jgi:hypothetical protein
VEIEELRDWGIKGFEDCGTEELRNLVIVNLMVS